MSQHTSARSRKRHTFHFFNVRHISSPEDIDNNRRVYTGHAPLSAIIGLPTDENVRDYLLEAEGKKRRRPTQVHKAIYETLKNDPESFSVLNSGVAIVARNCEVDEKNKCLHLTKPSIINGSQTQGVIKDFLEVHKDDPEVETVANSHIKFEVIVTDDEDLIAEISIARNFQNDVLTISIAGRRGHLDELERSLQARTPNAKLQKSETKLSDDYIKTERLLQVITALIPAELWLKTGEMNKVYAYSMKTKCLKEFQEVFKKAHDQSDKEYSKYSALYQFYLDIAADALELYEKWKSHQGFAGTGIRSIEREGSRIKEVPDGIVFPILASLSAFAKKTKDGWRILPPEVFNDSELIRSAKSAYQDIAHSNPWNMGKSKACYSTLYQVTSIYRRLSE